MCHPVCILHHVFLLVKYVICTENNFCNAYIRYRLTNRVQGEFFNSNGVRIHYTIKGKGDPVILLHGFAVNADLNWRLTGITQALAKEYRVISFFNTNKLQPVDRYSGLEHRRTAKPYGSVCCRALLRP